ncbi:MAG: autotransporter outer membrane beta-barrel domain-containing protein, partial [Devosia nanyangense]|nr:autotransporter outer membrane beta-barrel domain-containing protein [Devosia nanyangense]
MKGGAAAPSYRQTLLLSTALVVLAFADSVPAYAQSVIGNGDLSPGPAQSPNWVINGDLQIGNGSLDITGGGTVSNDTGMIGLDAGSDGTVIVSGVDANGNVSSWINAGDLYVGVDGTGTLHIEDGATVTNTLGSIGAGGTGIGAVTVSGVN